LAEQANAPLRVMTSESSWRCHRSYVGKPAQVRHARAFLAEVLEGCPMVDDAVLLISELSANAVLHSNSRKPGGLFTVHAEVHEGEYIWRSRTVAAYGRPRVAASASGATAWTSCVRSRATGAGTVTR
jgi:anti-sigma regulatory factor (Ser/Thr protein kinase)